MKATKGILILTKKFHQKRVLHASKIDVQSLVNQKNFAFSNFERIFLRNEILGLKWEELLELKLEVFLELKLTESNKFAV